MQMTFFLLAFLLSLLTTTVPFVGVLASGTTGVSTRVFYFHNESELYHNENASIIVLEEANVSVPTGSAPQVVEVAAAIRNATTLFGSIWVGSVAWISQPLAEPTGIYGRAVFSVWLSSSDSAPTFSGVGVGIAILNEKNETRDHIYTYSYAKGNVLTTVPKEYAFELELNMDIPAEQRLVFAVGLGSTTPAWQMKIYFDSKQYASLVQLPSPILVVAELAQERPVLAAVVIVVSLSLLQGKRPRQYRKF